ncbi:MAG: sulfotransferase [Hyphomicrobiales bacterium]|nr:MAG: sulfotransferase [Hyphomicrobiales bacterium]
MNETSTLPVSRLAMLAGARKSAPEYYGPFLDSDDEVLKVGAWCILLDRRDITLEQLPQLVKLARYASIRNKSFPLLQDIWEYALASQVAAQPLEVTEDRAEALLLSAKSRSDDAAQAVAYREQFLATGRTGLLRHIVQAIEHSDGWATALPYAVDGLLLAPHDPMMANALLLLLQQARQADQLDSAIEHLSRSDLHPYLQGLYRAALLQLRGDPSGALAALRKFSTLKPPRPDMLKAATPIALIIRAECLDKLGRYEEAYGAYVELNQVDQGARIKLESFGAAVVQHANVTLAPMAADPRAGNHFDMLGFPRSGTTLLENALAAHPAIETFEERPSMTAVRRYLNTHLRDDSSPEETSALFLEARERYYLELDIARRKKGASVFVDKLPIRSAEAKILIKLFPEKRYVFSIRHPFDVVLSCFKQHFAPNFAMEHFRRMDTAARLYDFALEQWFDTFSMDDERVHYVRYDALVTDFEATIGSTLSFLGLEWDDDVLNFASAADARSARTPSYQKVRQGLSIGVQSSWRNYGFLFESEAARPLYKWAEFFGYPTK